MKTKWLTYVKQMNMYQPGLAVFSEWLNDMADVEDELLLSTSQSDDHAKWRYKKGQRLHVCNISNKLSEW